ncbi:hypothetical protein SCD_n03103 (plasmid) [Sulfuricella denitrificans skB26]|uniref:Uncharacterized protein n=1 Tax=Sulfuricella denitrificans (strain DSM 22764 / NBRC 105220 / skB26) TaxID=1163617 RepID=S6B9A8_SULDS|nr:hypothetical protein [Sulfuricella denitrificans]BAN36902.1 hypothetical protein SCD_n03103 [Sulfuricella denitrificans skB26]
MTDTANVVLHPSILALVSLSANIAANHPKKGLCQLERLRSLGVSDAQIDIVVDIARHLRDEAGQMIDSEFNEAFAPAANTAAEPAAVTEGSCCAPTAKGNSCC